MFDLVSNSLVMFLTKGVSLYPPSIIYAESTTAVDVLASVGSLRKWVSSGIDIHRADVSSSFKVCVKSR